MPRFDPPPPDDDNDSSAEPVYEKPSKTQMKKSMHDLQMLGEALTDFNESRLLALPLSETLLEAVREFQRTRSFEGKRRQMQYIGKLMRHADVEPIREAVAQAQLGRAHDALALHESERWRDEMMASDDALTRWMDKYPASDLQQLRSLIRSARKDAAAKELPGAAQRKSRAYRELFQFVKQATGAQDDGAGDE